MDGRVVVVAWIGVGSSEWSPVVGGQAAIGSRAMSSSTMGSKAWRPGVAWRADQPVGGGEDPGRVGGPVARGQPQLDGLAGGIEADEVHPRRRAGPDRRRPRGRRGRSGAGGRRRSGGRGRRAVPDGRSRLARRCHSTRYGSNAVERAEQLDGRLDEPAEEDDAEAEVRGGDGRRPVLAEQRLDRGRSAAQPVVAMTNRRHPASSAAARLVATASAREASTTTSAPARSAGSCRSAARAGRATGRGRRRRGRRGRPADGPPERRRRRG